MTAVTQGPSPDDTIEILEIKEAAAARAHDETLRELDQLGKVRDKLREAIARKRGTCLCAFTRHASCQQKRAWCQVRDCMCDVCTAPKTLPAQASP